MDAETSAAQMMLGNIEQLRQNLLERRAIARKFDVSIQCMKKPQGGVGGVVKALVLTFGKHVRNQAIPDVVSERSQNPSGFGETPRRQGQTLEADHGVA